MNRHTKTMTSDTYTVPRRRSSARQWLSAVVLALFVAGLSTAARAQSLVPQSVDATVVGAQITELTPACAGNTAIDNGETVRLTLFFTNKLGRATAGNLSAYYVGTSSKALGVSITSAQPIGVVADGAASSFVVQFTASGVNPGDTIPLSFRFLEGVTQAGSDITYNVPVGQVVQTTTTVSNPAAIAFPGTVGAATTYPSTLNFASSSTATVSNLRVHIYDLTAGFPDDLQLLLVAPNGKKVQLINDAGGSSPLVGLTDLTFDDVTASVSAAPDNGPLVDGATYKTVNYDTTINDSDAYPLPAPAGPYTLNLSTFVGSQLKDLAGTWQLYAVDDAAPDTINIAGGWDIDFVTSGYNSAACNTAPVVTAADQSFLEDTANNFSVTVAEDGLGTVASSALALTVVSSDNVAIVPTNNLSVVAGASGGASKTFTFTVLPVTNAPGAAASGAANITVSAVNAVGLASTKTFKITFTQVNDNPTITGLVTSTNTAKNVSVTLPFTVGDIETSAANLQTFANAVDGSLISTLTFGGSGANRTLTVKPATDKEGATSITITVVDENGGVATGSFNITIGTPSGAPIISALAYPGIAGAATAVTNNEDNAAAVAPVVAVGAATFTVTSTTATAAKNLIVTAVSDNPGLFSALSVTPSTPTDGNRTLNYTLGLNQFTTTNASIIITATDPAGGSATTRLQVSVVSINDAPVFVSVSGTPALGGADPAYTTAINDNQAAIIDITLDDVESGADNVGLSVVSGNTAIIPANQVTVNKIGSPGKWRLTAVPVSGANGSSVLTVTADDKSGAGNSLVSKSITVNVTRVNRDPVYSNATNVITAEVAADTVITVSKWLTGLGDGDGLGQTVTPSIAVTSGAALLAVNPSLVANGADYDLVFTAKANSNGVVNATLTVADNGAGAAGGPKSVTKNVTITITEVNAAVDVTGAISNVSKTEAATDTTYASLVQTVYASAGNNSLDERAQTLSIDSPTIVSGGGLFVGTPALAIGTNSVYIVATVKAHTSGTAVITYKVKDNGTTAGAAAASTSAVQTLTYTVGAVEDLHTVTASSTAITINKNDTSSQLVTVTVNDYDAADQGTIGVTAASANVTGAIFTAPGALPVAVGGANSSQRLIVFNVNGTLGTGTITITSTGRTSAGVADAGDVKTTVVNVTVAAVNSAPTIALVTAAQTNITMLESTPTAPSAQIVNFTVNDQETALGTLAITATSSADSVIPANNLFVANSGAGNRTLVFSPKQSANGSAIITLTVKDDGDDGTGPLASRVKSASVTINVTVTPVNDAPILSGLPSKSSVLQSTWNQTNITRVPFTVSDIDGTNFAAFTVTATVLNTNADGTDITLGGQLLTRAKVLNASISITNVSTNGISGTLDLTSNGNLASGVNGVRVVAKDEAGLASGTVDVVVTVNGANNPPVIAGLPSTLTLPEGTTAKAYDFTISDAETATNLFVNNAVLPAAGITVTIVDNAGGFITAAALDSTGAFAGTGSRRLNLSTIANIFPVTNKTGLIRVVTTDNPTTMVVRGVPDVTITIPSVSVTNDIAVTVVPVNNAPTITAIADTTVNEDTATAPASFSIADVDNDISSLQVWWSNTNSALVGPNSVSLAGTGGSRTISVLPLTNAFGVDKITVYVSDGASTNSTSYKLTVNPVDDAPSISKPADQTIDQNTDTPLISFTVGDVESAAGSLTVTGVSSDTTIVPTANIFFGGNGANRKLIITPARNASGVVTITLTVTEPAAEGGLSSSTTFKLTINEKNQLPTLADITDVTTDQGKSVDVAITVTDPDGPTPFIDVTAVSANTSLIPNENILSSSVAGTGGTNRILKVVPAAGKSGSTAISVTATDLKGGSVSKSFNITVKAVNQAPVISAIAPVAVDQNGSTNVTFSVTDSDSASFTVAATSSNTGVVPASGLALTVTGTNGSLKITPANNQSGTSTISVVATDTEGASSTNKFVVTVNFVNQLPTITAIANQSTKEAQAVSVNFSVSDVETAVTNLVTAATSDKPALTPAANIKITGTGAIRTLSITPAAGQSGSAVITVTVTDGNSGTSSSKFTLAVSAVNRNDVNGDGKTDIILQNADGFLAVWYMDGKNQIGGGFLNPSNPGDKNWHVVGSGDFNSDTKQDLLFQHTDGTLAVWYMDGTNLVSAALLQPSNPGDKKWHVAATADVDGDGKRDILFQHEDGTLAVWYLNGATLVKGELLSPSLPDSADWLLVAAADFNGDGKADLVFQNRTTRTLAVWYMNGSKLVDAELLNPFDPQAGWHVVGAGDLNGDGQADLLLQNDNGGLQVWFMRGPNGVDRQFLNPVSAGAGWSVVAPN